MSRSMFLVALIPLALAGRLAQSPSGVQGLTPVGDSWVTYHGDPSGRHFSSLKQITTQNVRGLSLAWTYRANTAVQGAVTGGPPAGETPGPGRGGAVPPGGGGAGAGPFGGGAGPARGPDIKAIPLAVDGVLYLSTPTHAWAIDARTGDEIWHYAWQGRSVIGNRGIGKYGDALFMETGENSLVSLDAKTGKERWVKSLAETSSTNFSTSAPIVVKNHVIVGIGGDSGNGYGWVEARDPETGELQWKWNVTPRANEPGIETWPSEAAALRGSGGVWQPPTYDASLNLLYVTTGQPTPTYNGAPRPGANLYTCSVVALDADTGKMAWYYQFSAHDTHDWDSTQVPMLIDGLIDGQPRKLLAQANRNGYFFLLDRTNGKSLVTRPFLATANGYLGVDERGQLIRNPAKDPSPSGALVFPDSDGAANYPAGSFSPETGLLYFNSTNAASLFYLPHDAADPSGFGRGTEYHTGLFESTLLALDYRTGRTVWQHKYPQVGFWSSTYPGVLTTAGGVLFTGDPSGNFVAYDSKTGKILWHAPLGKAVISNTPITYQIQGRQFVVVACRDLLYGFYLQ